MILIWGVNRHFNIISNPPCWLPTKLTAVRIWTTLCPEYWPCSAYPCPVIARTCLSRDVTHSSCTTIVCINTLSILRDLASIAVTHIPEKRVEVPVEAGRPHLSGSRASGLSPSTAQETLEFTKSLSEALRYSEYIVYLYNEGRASRSSCGIVWSATCAQRTSVPGLVNQLQSAIALASCQGR